MNGIQLYLWLPLLLLLLHTCVGQDEAVGLDTTDGALDVELTTVHVRPSTAEEASQAAADSAPASPLETAPESPAEPAPEPEPAAVPAPESEHEPVPAAEPAPETPAEAEPAAEPAPESEPTTGNEHEPAPEAEAETAPGSAPESTPESPAEPAPEPQPDPEPTAMDTPTKAATTVAGDMDYQNDAVDITDNPTHKPSSEAPTMATKPKPAETGLDCYSCSSYQKGKCDEKPTESTPCAASNKNGCYTLIKRDTKLIMRGCRAELSEEGDAYCRKEPKLCQLCYDKLCNKQLAPLVDAGAVKLLGSILIWMPCIIALL